ncbi:MAG: radical SAM family heme chaperone HemW [Ruminococcus sp.]|nr:radical SAM family heme chaperone HemW [Ruminococcus sp.]
MTTLLTTDMTGLYIHIPFCKRKCPYCDFYSLEGQGTKTFDVYISRLIKEAQSYNPKNISVDTIYIGGGTPSLLSAEQVATLLNALKESFIVSDNAEITLEANPSSVDENKLSGYLNAGINRLSFGIQSALDDELLRLGRLHNFERAREAVTQAHNIGFKNISADLMIATEGQTPARLRQSVLFLTSLPIQHISCYMLKIEDGTPFSKRNLSLPDDDESAELYLTAVNELKSSGFNQYEISNFSKEGFESRHNLKYWQGEEYIGLGTAAYSYFEGVRFHNERDLKAYLNGDDIRQIDERNIDKAEEYLLLSLRLSKGVSLKKYISLGGSDKFLQKAKDLPANLIEINGDNIHLTAEGFLVSNDIIARLQT